MRSSRAYSHRFHVSKWLLAVLVLLLLVPFYTRGELPNIPASAAPPTISQSQ